MNVNVIFESIMREKYPELTDKHFVMSSEGFYISRAMRSHLAIHNEQQEGLNADVAVEPTTKTTRKRRKKVVEDSE